MGGYLEKMGSGMLKKKWQRYWCVLFRGEASPGIIQCVILPRAQKDDAVLVSKSSPS